MPENSEGYPIDPQITSNDEVEKPRTLESHRTDRVRRLGGVRGRLAAIGLGVATAVGSTGVASAEEQDVSKLTILNPSTIEVKTREESELEIYLEGKYGIELLNTKESYRARGFEVELNDEYSFGDPPYDWPPDHIELLDRSIARLPVNFANVFKNESMKFTLTDFGNCCSLRAGQYEHGEVKLDKDYFNPNDMDQSFRIVTHEIFHGIDDANNWRIGTELVKIAGFESWEDFRDHYKPIVDKKVKRGKLSPLIDSRLNYAFMGSDYDGAGKSSPVELGPALSEIYISGEFMELQELFGKETTEEWYEIYKSFFSGQENFDPVEINDDAYRVDAVEKARQDLKKYNIEIVNTLDRLPQVEDIRTLQKIIEAFPTNILRTADGKQINIVFTDDLGEQRHDGNTIFVTPDSLRLKKWTDIRVPAEGIIAHELAYRVNEMKGFEPQKVLVDKLFNGEYSEENFRKLFPRLFKENSSEFFEDERMKFFDDEGNMVPPEVAISNFVELYVRGQREFEAIIGSFFEFEEYNYNDLYKPNMTKKELNKAREKEKKLREQSIARQIYSFIGHEFFNGTEFSSGSEGIPNTPVVNP